MSGRTRREGSSACYARGVRYRVAALAIGISIAASSVDLAQAQETATEPATAGAPAPAPPAVASARALKGVAVLVPGSPDEALGKGCRDLAREVYKIGSLTPSMSEAEVRTLCGGDPGPQPGPKKLAELRQGLAWSLDGATSRVIAQAMADDLGVRALVLLGRDTNGGQAVRVIRAGLVEDRVAIYVEPTRLELVARAPSADATPVVPWVDAAKAIEILARDEGEARSDGSIGKVDAITPEGAAPEIPAGPRKEKLVGAKTTAPPAEGADDTKFYESPWFWVAAGSVAAVGLTVLIVSQTTDVDEGSIPVQGKVLP